MCLRRASNPTINRPWFGYLPLLRKALKLAAHHYETSPSPISASCCGCRCAAGRAAYRANLSHSVHTFHRRLCCLRLERHFRAPNGPVGRRLSSRSDRTFGNGHLSNSNQVSKPAYGLKRVQMPNKTILAVAIGKDGTYFHFQIQPILTWRKRASTSTAWLLR
jgi:hypothetical protein